MTEQTPNPTPDEIRARCIAIRMKWSRDELRKRSSWAQPAPYEPPVCVAFRHGWQAMGHGAYRKTSYHIGR